MTKKTTKTETNLNIDETIKAEDVKSTTTVKTKVAEGAREFVRRSAANAKERSDDMYETSAKFNSGLESALSRIAGGYVAILGNLAEATHENVDRALTTVEKLANAQSVSEAVRIQSDYVRENTTANINRTRDAVEVVRGVAVDGVEMARENVKKVWPYNQKAA